MNKRNSLIARVSQMRKTGPTGQAQSGAGSRSQPGSGATMADLETRISHLEAMVEGLQDSLHRESTRHDERMTALEKRMEPATLAVALQRDARERGL